MNSLKPYKSLDDQKLHESKVLHYSTDQLREYTHKPFQQELDQNFDQNSDLTIVGTADGYIHAIDQSNNKKLWSVDTGGPMLSSSQIPSSSSSSSSSSTLSVIIQ
jgi:glucose dehydrogenase